GDFKRLRIQDIEDMLLLLVPGKLINLTVEERIAFNVSLRMFTRSIVIQRCVEDLQLGVESYQKKLNLTKPDTFDTSAGNPVKEILLKLSLPDHRIFKDGGEALRWQLEEIHVTWAHLGKKRTRLQLYTKVEEEKCIQTLETASQFIATTSEVLKDGVRNFVTASERNRLKEALEQSAERRHKDYKAIPSC
ncbi:hypothetical protein Tco_1159303, partial [Tanacetum coccineum]